MLTVQPPFITNYFERGQTGEQPQHVHRSFYLSWEDAFWHILQLYQAKPGSVALVPEFYCGNVIEHMQEHGLMVKTYPVNKKLQTPVKDFVTALKQSNPDIVIIFHAVGINNSLTHQVDEWLPIIGEDAILIEDRVHNIIDPQKIRFFSQRHFLIDSLRKVVPVQGSNLYSPVPIPPTTQLAQLTTIPYRLGVLTWWMMMQLFLVGAYKTTGNNWARRYNRMAEWAMIHGYDSIGKSRLPARGNQWMNYLSQNIASKKIEQVKIGQARSYRLALKQLIVTKDFWLPRMDASDDKNLRGFPLIISLDVADRFLSHLRKAGVLVRFELNDSEWSERQKIVYLPMGIHITKPDVEKITLLLKTFALY